MNTKTTRNLPLYNYGWHLTNYSTDLKQSSTKKNTLHKRTVKAIVLLILGLLCLNISYAQFTSGRLVVLQAGNGTETLINTGNSLFLKEYTTTGTAGTSVTIPNSGANALITSGSATSEGLISLASDGQSILIPGYNTSVGGATSLTSTTAAAVPRSVGKVDYSGTYTLASASATAYSNNNIRGAAGDGTNFWAAGANTGICYFGPGTAATVSTTTTNNRMVAVFNSQLYFSTGSGTTRGIYAVGTGLPITSGQTSVNVVNTGASSSSYGFTFNTAGTICYVADDASGIKRYNFSAGVWTLAYTLNSTNARGLCADFSGANPVVYATTTAGSANAIIKITDTGAGSSSTTIATAPAATVFRGITFAPAVAGGVPVKLAITSVNSGSSPSVNTPFSITIESQDAGSLATSVVANTNVSISLATGTGSVGGTLTGTINAGFSSATISGITYNTAESGVSLTATRTSGDILTPGTSALFTVLPAASQLVILNFPTFSFSNNIIPTFTVEAQRPDNSVDLNYSGNVTLSLNTGTGNVNGTLTKPCVAGVATFNDISFDASGVKTVAANSGSLTTAISGNITIQTATLTEIILPKFIQGINGTNNNRVPYAYRVALDGLNASSTYRYINQVVIAGDPANSNGAGNIIFRDPSFFYRTTSASLASAGSYGEFTTDASGHYEGWFITEPTGNATRFIPGNDVFMRIILNDGNGGTTPLIRLTTTNSARVVNFGSGATDGTGLRGNSLASPRNFVFMYDNTGGTGRPIAGTFVELDGSDNTATPYVPFYSTDVNDINGAYGLIIPNNLPDGIRRIEQRDLATGALAGCPSTDADGVWPSTVNTVNPSSGTTPLVILQTDAELDPAGTSSADPASASASPANVCTGQTTDLSVTGGSLGAGASWKWYTGSCGGALVGTGSPFTTSGLTSSTTFFVRAEGLCNTTNCVQVNVVVSTAAPAASVVVPPINNLPGYACNGTSVLNINVPSVANATQYIWDGPTGTTFNGSGNPYTSSTPSANITFGNPNGSGYTIGVQAANACGASLRKTQWVRGITSVPAAVVPATPGLVTYCANTGPVTFSCPPVAGATSYLWSITGDATVTGTGTTGTVNFGPSWTGGTLCVAAQTLCYTSPTKCIALTTGINPSVLPVISGVATGCPASTQTYSIVGGTGANSNGYSWTLPANTTGSSTSASINVTFNPGFTSGNICVTATSLCGIVSTPRCKSVSTGVPLTPSGISGPANGICGQNATYTTLPIGGVNYNWTLPTGATGTSTTNSINTTMPGSPFPSSPNNKVCVSASNICGTSGLRCITVKGAPNTPGALISTPASWCAPTAGIEFVADVSGLGGSYTLNWVVIPAANATYVIGQGTNDIIYDWTIAGAASVNLTAANGCGNATRALGLSIAACRTGGNESTSLSKTADDMLIYPNPATCRVNVEFLNSSNKVVRLTLTDLAGRVVMNKNLDASNGFNKTAFDVSGLAKGMYLIELDAIDYSSKKSLIIE